MPDPDYLERAQPYLQAGDAHGALEMVDKAIEQDAEDFQAWRMKGLLLSALGQPEAASEAIARADQLDIGGIDGKLAEAAQLAMSGDYAGALAIYGVVLEEDPTLHEVWSATSLVQLEAGNKAAALDAIAEALAIEPNDPHLNYTHGHCLRLCGYNEKGVAAFAAAIDREPNHSLAIYEKGMCHEQLGDLEAAIDCFEEVLKIAPGDPNATQAVAAVRSRQDQGEDTTDES